ncbi:protein CDV3 homolog isoform X2 [Dysidea avara]|uniref:protein CDV3 homolog isoform X2 n=1 Tax=Dysidea avara TaxID=196820 RepID=UPI003316D42B
MAEDLDSFFKKKKSKGKKKYTTSDAIKKAVEDSQKVEEQKKSLTNDEDVRTVDPQDDEWIEVKKVEADLSSLKVQSFGTNQSEETGDASEEILPVKEDITEKAAQGGKQGPWNVSTASATVTPTPVTTTTTTAEADDIPEVPNVSMGKYVPPSLRNKQQQQQQVSSGRKQPSRYPKKPPDITSQQAFPSLLSNKEESSSDQESIKQQQQQQQQINMARGIREPIVEHHNRYTALSES